MFSQAKTDAGNSRDEIRVVSWRRGLSTRGLKKDLIKRLLHEDGAQALTEEAAAALLLVRRRLGSKPEGFALTDDAWAIRWIAKAQPRCEGLQFASLGSRQV